MKIFFLLLNFLFILQSSFAGESITPYKFTDQDITMPTYTIPASSRFNIERTESYGPAIVYYLSKPQSDTYPIAILCGGSSTVNDIRSIIHFHRYFLQEFLDLNCGVLTIEQWGVDGNIIDKQAYLEHYTRSQRLHDHEILIDYLQVHPPAGWNGKLVLLGVSEGGPLVTSLTTKYSPSVIATINWSGAGDWSWRDELWIFIETMRTNAPWWLKIWDTIPCWFPFALPVPKTRNEYDALMDQTLTTPITDKEFMGMTYKYHADSLTYPQPHYDKIQTPFLVISGAQDSIIHSSDAFVEKAKEAEAPITYVRVPDMDHYVRRRPDIIEQSFAWLKQQLT